MPLVLQRCRAFGTVCLLLAVTSVHAQGPPQKKAAAQEHLASDKKVEKLLGPIREKHKVPGLIGAIVDERGIKTIAAVGFRKFASPESITVNDKFRIGPCTMTMTATQIALLTGTKKVSLQTTIGEVLAAPKSPVHGDFQKVTIEQLLTHRAGLPSDGPYDQAGQGNIADQRESLAKIVLGKRPAYAPGTKSLFSPLGYVIAAHLAERVVGKPWEELMQAGLFKELSMASAGFGLPGAKGKNDHPWGHRTDSGKAKAVQFAAPEVANPAQGVYCAPVDWAKFLALHVTGLNGESTLLPMETLRTLQTPPAGESLAAGWQREERPWANGWALVQQGGDESWYADVWLAPEIGVGFLTIANQGGEPGFRACDEAAAALIDQYVSSLSDKQINALLDPIREKHKVPALFAGIVSEKGLSRGGAVGIRKLGAPERVTLNDTLHIGSNTKAMTATLIGELVEEQKLSLQSTIGDVFGRLKSSIHPDCQRITVEQLLTHRAGLPANVNYLNLPGTVVEQREALLKNVLSQPPLHAPGSQALYSNVGFIVAGHCAEQVTGRSWEDLLTERVFRPLTMRSAGFGVPGLIGRIDQPWGHSVNGDKVEAVQIDNPPVLGPAGTVHCTLRDWAKFAALHLQGARGKAKLLKPATFKVLHAPHGPPADDEFAMGWVIQHRPWTRGPILQHNGSNTTWYATIWVAPELDVAFLAASNQGAPAGASATDEAIAALIDLQKKSPRRGR